MKDYDPKDLSKYKGYDQEMLMSVCRFAFEMFHDIPPHDGNFYLARFIGYEIPDKWTESGFNLSNTPLIWHSLRNNVKASIRISKSFK